MSLNIRNHSNLIMVNSSHFYKLDLDTNVLNLLNIQHNLNSKLYIIQDKLNNNTNRKIRPKILLINNSNHLQTLLLKYRF